MRARAHVVFRGHVQGVFFRANCRERALELGLTGWVRNRYDGSVEAVFEGEKEAVEEAIAWNRTSQPHARVADVEVAWAEATGGFRTFEIRR
ncbi:MAG: acylphosphatase [Euryarchaeota archaeon]|nr:acylphosphatase [Euryarchaeota archaeon]